MKKEKHFTTSAKPTTRTLVQLTFDITDEAHREWSTRMCKNLTIKGYELVGWDVGFVEFMKERKFIVGE